MHNKCASLHYCLLCNMYKLHKPIYKNAQKMLIWIKKGGDYMEMTELLQAISTVGFPIVMCIALLLEIKEITRKHEEESKTFTDALNKNTLVIQKLCDFMSKGEK